MGQSDKQQFYQACHKPTLMLSKIPHLKDQLEHGAAKEKKLGKEK